MSAAYLGIEPPPLTRKGSPDEAHAARRTLAEQAVRLHPDDAHAALRRVLDLLGLLPGQEFAP